MKDDTEKVMSGQNPRVPAPDKPWLRTPMDVQDEQGHIWFDFENLACCKVCGIVKRADGKNRPCPGVTPQIALR